MQRFIIVSAPHTRMSSHVDPSGSCAWYAVVEGEKGLELFDTDSTDARYIRVRSHSHF
jgi:hypothetical protein